VNRINGCGIDRGVIRIVSSNWCSCDTLAWGVKLGKQKAVVNSFTACDLIINVCIGICVCRFLIGNSRDVKLIAQLAINDG
jgi:hypothetical protein